MAEALVIEGCDVLGVVGGDVDRIFPAYLCDGLYHLNSGLSHCDSSPFAL